MNSRRRAVISLLLLSSLAACGFQMRGTRADSKLSFQSLYLDASARTPLERELRAALKTQDGLTLTTDPKSADVSLFISSAIEEKKVLTLNAQGQVREFSLLYRLNFNAKDSAGKVLIPSTELALQSSMAFSESQALAKETEERMIFADLRGDAVSQIIRRLTRISSEK
jgi:LPS-assembly lipoprotein